MPVSSEESDIQIRVDDVSKSIGSKTTKVVILQNISFSVPRHALCAIIGPTLVAVRMKLVTALNYE